MHFLKTSITNIFFTGRISRSARELKNKNTAPVMAGILAGCGGAFVRIAFDPVSSSIDALESTFWRTISYSLLWWWLAVKNCEVDDYVFSSFFKNYDGSDDDLSNLRTVNQCDTFSGSIFLRVVFVGGHTTWAILAQTGIVSGHPLVWSCRTFFCGRAVRYLIKWLRLGPIRTSDDVGSGEENNSVSRTNGSKKDD